VKKIEVQASTNSSAQPEKIYSLLENSATYPLWSMIEFYESLHSGADGGIHKVGAIRLFRTGPFTMHEKITVMTPNLCVGYSLLSGFPMLDYSSMTTLEKIEAGTRITWASSFYPKYPMTGWFWRGFMGWTLRRMVVLLARAAEDENRRSKILALAQGKTMAKGAMAQIL
jgi:hypothetical protein